MATRRATDLQRVMSEQGFLCQVASAKNGTLHLVLSGVYINYMADRGFLRQVASAKNETLHLVLSGVDINYIAAKCLLTRPNWHRALRIRVKYRAGARKMKWRLD